MMINAINEYLATDKSAKAEYTPQQLANSEVYARMYLAYEGLAKEQSARTDELQLAFDHESERIDLLKEEKAKRREEEGWLNAAFAVGTIIIGGAAIALTWGAATPVVVTACVAGGSTIMYGTSNLVEAGQDIYYGSIGDIETVAFNPIRDTVFCGNQELYDIWGTVSTTVSGMIIPSGQAFAALRAAHPTAVLITTSAANGAITAGTSSVKQQFAETGSLGEINWGKVALDTTAGGFIGGTTGALGSGISNGATTLLSKSATISSLLNSESAVTRIATNFAIGSVAEVGSGMGTRFVGGLLTGGGDFKEAGMQAINPQNMLFDFALGGTMRSFNGLQKPRQQSFADMMSPKDAARYNQYWDDVAHGIDTDTRVRLNQWDYRPDAELYLQYQDVYDNPKYYNQQNGEIQWPINNGFAGDPINEVLQPGTRIDRYGSDFGSFTSPEGTPYEARAVAPGTDQKPYSVFEVVKPIEVKSGVVAPWFNQQGGGIQYHLPKTVDELLDDEIIRRITQ